MRVLLPAVVFGVLIAGAVAVTAPALEPSLQDIAGDLARAPNPTRIFVASEFITMDPHKPRVQAVAVRDGRFVADVPELPGCMAHGSTQEAALANAKEAMRLWIDTARDFGDPIPEPKGRRLMYA